jgi:hypothetical protein
MINGQAEKVSMPKEFVGWGCVVHAMLANRARICNMWRLRLPSMCVGYMTG